MTATLATNAKNDLYLGGDGNIVLLTDLPAVEAVCENISKAQLGEMMFQTTQGMPNFQALWVGSPNIPLWQSYLRSNLLSTTPDVLEVTDVTMSQINNKFSYTAKIKTIYGAGEING